MGEADKSGRAGRATMPKQIWVTPILARMAAADAELGANPLTAEGIFAQGS